MKKLNWGIMGLGGIAKEFADNMNKIHEIYAAASRNSERTKEFCERYNVSKAYNSYEEMLLDEDLDVVYIATVNSQHYKNIMECLKHDKHVLCEKAIWHDEGEMQEAYALAKSKKLFLGEAMTIYHMPLFRKIKKMIGSGALGKIKLVQANFGSLKEDNPLNRYFSKELGGGAMLDIGTYALSFVAYFLSSQPREIKNVITEYQTGVDEMWGIVMKNAEEEIGSVNLTFRAKLPKQGIIAGDKAYILVNNYPRADKAEIVYPDGTSEVITEGDSKRAFEYEIKNTEEAILSQNYDLGKMDLSLQVVAIMDKLLKGMR